MRRSCTIVLLSLLAGGLLWAAPPARESLLAAGVWPEFLARHDMVFERAPEKWSQGATNVPLRGGKVSTLEGGIRVPALMSWPGRLKGGRTLAQVMSVMDVFPTLAAAAGVKPLNTKPLDGNNMWPAITSGEIEPRDSIFFASQTIPLLRFAVIRRQWKLVREIRASDQAATDYLYHMGRDPTEQNDISPKRPDLVRSLTGEIQQWYALHPPGGTSDTKRLPPGKISPERWAEAARR